MASLRQFFQGELYDDTLMRTLYATDASVYREMPFAVAFPKNDHDLKLLITFASEQSMGLIPRTAGTSLAGQCVGNGIVVDFSKYFTQILELNEAERWVWVQPGVVRDELNLFLKDKGLFFAPDTSTSNRCMIGGMVGNNSCGSTSIKYGSTREHLLEAKALLHDGSEAHFMPLSKAQLAEKCHLNNSEGAIYRAMNEILCDETNQSEIISEFPNENVSRRNTGYALDALLFSECFSEDDIQPFNVCKLLAGSEGTLALTTAVKLNLMPLPPPHKALLIGHFNSIDESLRATQIAVQYYPEAIEMMDNIVLECTESHVEFSKYRFFIDGKPKAIICVEFAAKRQEDLQITLQQLKQAWQAQGYGYSYPVVEGKDIAKVWALRKAGLGLLSNIPGDAKPVAFVEDTAVAVQYLPEYIAEFNKILEKYGKRAVHYAHAGAGELHLRPILNLKDPQDVVLFRTIAEETAQLVKKYEGSNSGEHGDGRVRGEFLPLLVGEHNYDLLRQVKRTWDPQGIFNPGKIVDTPPMDTSLRYEAGQITKQFDTIYDFSEEGGILRAIEKCNGSGDCRKSHLMGGTMCPSYMATHNEKDSTRARANILRELLTRSNATNPFDHPEIEAAMDLCISCKGCVSECPSNVDMATLKSEFLYQKNRHRKASLQTDIFGNFSKWMERASWFPGLSKMAMNMSLTKKMAGVAAQRTLPKPYPYTLAKWYQGHKQQLVPDFPRATVYLFNDEFTNYIDVEIGIKTIELLSRLRYRVEIPEHRSSARTQISKGLLEEARQIARDNIKLLGNKVSDEKPLIGIEPSAILGFRDEYIKLAAPEQRATAQQLAKHTLTIEEFFAREIERGHLTAADFTEDHKKVLVHGHCHQKALSTIDATAWMLSLPQNYEVEIVPSGCCGMAGSFGYEEEHFDISMKIGELVLFPAVRSSSNDTIIAAAGNSCRHQIADGTQRRALHPVEVLHAALLRK